MMHGTYVKFTQVTIQLPTATAATNGSFSSPSQTKINPTLSKQITQDVLKIGLAHLRIAFRTLQMMQLNHV